MRRFILLLLLMYLLSGCTYYAPPGQSHSSRVVTSIDVTASENGQLLHYRYTEQQKMGAILNYLRQLDPDVLKPITPDTFRTDAYEIRIQFSDGSQTVYHQIYDQYLKKDNGQWHRIDRIQGSMLQPLLTSLPSDDA